MFYNYIASSVKGISLCYQKYLQKCMHARHDEVDDEEIKGMYTTVLILDNEPISSIFNGIQLHVNDILSLYKKTIKENKMVQKLYIESSNKTTKN